VLTIEVAKVDRELGLKPAGTNGDKPIVVEPVRGRGIAFKVDAKGRAVPKGPADINNAYGKTKFPEQHDLFRNSVMAAGHQAAAP